MRAALAGVAALGLALTGCGAAESTADKGGTVTVFAAASLTETFTKLGKDFEAAHPGTRVVFNFAGSSALATQITQGAPADVFAAASPATMKTVTDAGDAAGTPAVLVRNQLVVAVPEGNPDRVASLADLARPGLKVALCAEQVPCGAAAKSALAAAGVRLTPATLEQDVKGALAKVKLGEADAALVYRTDVRGAAGLAAVEFPESARAVNDYPIVVLTHAGNPAGARAFVDHVRSDAGLAVLTAAGFQAPPSQ
ncbi:molybdate ABC transporter substrate-binding protein [Micromonospora sp. NPDC004540]|uniref:molybdate ABC transporter substrate-binding protein n=1 Tax=Micromonospora sp. NPDC004540 TaxID=3154457 RepID=UPI0033AA4E66